MGNLKSRKLIVENTARTTANFFINNLLDKPDNNILEGEKNIGPFIIPDYQRPLVWTLEQKKKLVSSFLDNWHIGVFIVNHYIGGINEDDTYGHLIDGQQRLTAIYEWSQMPFLITTMDYITKT